MGWWSFEHTAEVDATLVDALHHFSDLEGVVDWNDNFVGHEILKGSPNENGSIGTAVFEPIDFDSTRISMTMRFDVSNFSLVSRPLRKALVKVMARDMTTRFGDSMTQRRVDQLVSEIKEESE
ncbi:MAG: hypothetical protein JHC98_05530 [Thermoleophilaceae bacterium]|nr:hypothetical protein [Thermoleophilaceae bacterium]